MAEVVSETLEEAEKKLRQLAWALDRTEYDGDDEFEEQTKGIFPEQITAQAKHAAELGSAIGLHTYANLLLHQALEQQQAGEPYEELQAQARELAMRSARAGCWGAMDDIGRMKTDQYGVGTVDMLAFMELAGGDMMDYVEHCHASTEDRYSQEEIDAALAMAKAISEEMAAAGIEKQQCDCFDPFQF